VGGIVPLYMQKGDDAVTVFEALIFAITFASFIVSILSYIHP
jgi:hypothetical protein